MSDANFGAEIDIFKKEPIIDQIPALNPLLNLDGTGLPIYCRGPRGDNEFRIRSLRFFGSEISPNNMTCVPNDRIIFIIIGNASEPVGYIEYIIGEKKLGAAVSKCTFHNPSTLMFNVDQVPNWVDHDLNPKSDIFGGDGFFISPEWSQFGLGQILLAASSAVLEKIGLQRFVVFDDATIQYHDPNDKQGGPRNTRVAFKSDPLNPSFVAFQPVTSAYSRYSGIPITQFNFTDQGKFPFNLKKTPIGAYQVPTRLSAMQVSLLTRALTPQG